MRAYHYTPHWFLESMQEAGRVEPRSLIGEPFKKEECSSVRTPSEKYLFCLPHPAPKNWVEYGVLEALLHNISHIKANLRLLSFDIRPEDEVFVLELEPMLSEEGMNSPEGGALQEYVDSMVPLEEYGHDYEFPEVVVGNNVEMSRVEVRNPMSLLDTVFLEDGY